MKRVLAGLASAMALALSMTQIAEAAQADAHAATVAPTPALDLAFEITVLLGAPVRLGQTARGGRNIIPILGGRFHGGDLSGEVVPGGWDWQLERGDGCIEIKADYMLKTDDGVTINILDTGVNCLGSPHFAQPPRTQPFFEAPIGKYGWLSRSAFIGAAEPYAGSDGKGLRIRVYRVK